MSHLLTNRVFALPEERRVNLNKQRNNDHMSKKEHSIVVTTRRVDGVRDNKGNNKYRFGQGDQTDLHIYISTNSLLNVGITYPPPLIELSEQHLCLSAASHMEQKSQSNQLLSLPEKKNIFHTWKKL